MRVRRVRITTRVSLTDSVKIGKKWFFNTHRLFHDFLLLEIMNTNVISTKTKKIKNNKLNVYIIFITLLKSRMTGNCHVWFGKRFHRILLSYRLLFININWCDSHLKIELRIDSLKLD